MRNFKQTFFLVFILTNLISTTISFSQSFYVDGGSGNDSNTGNSLASAWKTIQHAMNISSDGSTVYIKGGTYIEQLIMNVSGTSGNQIVFRNYQNDSVKVDGNNANVTLLSITDKSFVTIQGLIFQNTLGNGCIGITINGASENISIKKNLIQNIRWTASASTIPTSNDNCNPFVVYGDNASTSISNLVVDSNEIRNNINGFSENLTLDGNVSGFIISHNKVHNNTNIGILCAGHYQTSSNPATDQARNGTVSDNETYNNVSLYATSGGLYVDGGRKIIVERNKSYGNGYGIEIGCEQPGTVDSVTVRDNIFFNNQTAGLAIGGYNYPTTGQVLNCIVSNNVLFNNDYSQSGTGEFYLSKVSNCLFENNITFTSSQNIVLSSDYASLQNNTYNYNDYYSNDGASGQNLIQFNFNMTNYTGFSAYQIGTSQDANSMFADPTFVNSNIANPATINFSLQSGSGCVDKGDPIHVIINNELDFFGNTRIINSRIDIGAVEYGNITSIQNEKGNNLFISIYPNPTKNILYLKYSEPVESFNVEIFDMRGNKIKPNQMNDSGVGKIDLSSLENGLYLINIFLNNQYQSFKIVKIN